MVEKHFCLSGMPTFRIAVRFRAYFFHNFQILLQRRWPVFLVKRPPERTLVVKTSSLFARYAGVPKGNGIRARVLARDHVPRF